MTSVDLGKQSSFDNGLWMQKAAAIDVMRSRILMCQGLA